MNRPRPSHVVVVLAFAGVALLPTGATAQTGGASYGAAKPRTAPAAPALPPLRPVVEQITCRAACSGIVRARAGSVVRLTGEGLDRVARVVFLGRRGPHDDRVAAARGVAPGAVEATIPRGARSGPVRVLATDRRRSVVSRRTITVGGRAPRRPAIETRSDTRRVFLGGAASASVSFYLRRATAVSVDVVRAADGTAVAHWDVPPAPAGSVQSVTWDGLTAGLPSPEGRYVWRVEPAGAASRAARVPGGAAAATGPSFFLLAHRFPVLGPHTYGDGLGAGRGHGGVDVFAACGTPLVAAIGGTVKHVAFQGRAGNYVVIGGSDGVDYAYMHLRERSPLREGEAVATGAPIGAVGDTGRASGCHLHFEMWSSPGWYTGGSAMDPMPHLRAWDGLS